MTITLKDAEQWTREQIRAEVHRWGKGGINEKAYLAAIDRALRLQRLAGAVEEAYDGDGSADRAAEVRAALNTELAEIEKAMQEVGK